MKYFLFLICISLNTYAVEFENTKGKTPEGNHCMAYAFARMAEYNALPQKYRNAEFWIKTLESSKNPPLLGHSLDTWKEITKIHPQIILEPGHPLKNETNIFGKKLLWIGQPHPASLPETVTETYMHACILEAFPHKAVLHHFGDDSKPFMKEYLTWPEFFQRTICLYIIDNGTKYTPLTESP
jgi:hypothetical protein